MDTDPPLLSLRLLVPPLRVMTAFMWQVAHQQNVEHFGKLEAFVSDVLKILPDLLNSRQKVSLIMGLRTKMLLEMCRNDAPADPKTFSGLLREIQSRHLKNSKNSELDNMQSHLSELVANLLVDPVEKEYFFKMVYPVEYGADFDKALQVLVCYFISRLEKFLPVPNFKQVSSWVDSASLWDECEQHLSQLEHLHTLSQNSNYHGDLGETDLPSIVEDRIMSTLSPQDKRSEDSDLNNLEKVPSVDFTNPSSHELQDRHQARPSVSKNQGGICNEKDTGLDLDMETGMEEDSHHHNSLPIVGLGVGETPKAPAGISSVAPKHPLLSHGPDQSSAPLGGAVLQTVVPLEVVTVIQVDQSTTEKLNVSLPKAKLQPSLLQQQEIVLVLTDVSSTNSTKAAVKVLPSHNVPVSSNLHRNQLNLNKNTTSGTTCVPRLLNSQLKNFKCIICGLVFGSMDKWRSHRQSHKANMMPYKCDHCSREFKQLSGLRCHQKWAKHQKCQAHLKDSSAPACSQLRCDKKTKSKTGSGPINPRQFKCFTCGLVFGSLSRWRSHRQTHMENMIFKCDHCNREFKQLSGLRAHQQVRGDLEDPSLPPCLQPKRIRATENLEPGQCRYCGETFPGAIELRSHIKTHPEHKPYQCDQCDKRFSTKTAFETHKKSHTGKKPYLCSDCGKQYCSLLQLKAHMRFHGDAVKECCPYCGKQFVSRGNLNVHMRQHTGEKPYVCSVCEKAFYSAGLLQIHMRIHTGERPYRCEVCGKGFVASTHRQVHMRIHNGDRPFTCNHCRKGFYTRWALNTHMHTHTGMKPYKCSICPKSYTTRNHLNRHLQTHRTGKP